MALQVVQKGMELGIQCFKEMMPQFLNERISGIKMEKENIFIKVHNFHIMQKFVKRMMEN